MSVATRHLEELANAPQQRLAVTPSGRQVWIPITVDDRVACIDEIGKVRPRIAAFMKLREQGAEWEQLERQARCSPEQLREAISAAWSIYETMLCDLAARRAALLP